MTGAIHILNTKSAKTLSTTLGDATHGEDAGGGSLVWGYENEERKLFQSPEILVRSTIEDLNNNINQPVVVVVVDVWLWEE